MRQLENTSIIGQRNRNQKVGKGLEVTEDLVVNRDVFFDYLKDATTKNLGIDSNGKIIVTDGGGGISNLFPNGVDFVTTSRDFQSSDAGKRLMLSGTDISVTMPAINPFDIGDYVGIVSDGIDCAFNVENGGDLIYPLKTGDGSTSECVILMNTVLDGDQWLLPISTSFIYDNADDNKKKTALRYLYEKQQSPNEQVIALGTITFADVNTAPASTIIDINLPTASIPIGFYLESLFFNTIQAFDAGITSSSLYTTIGSLDYPINLTQVIKKKRYAGDGDSGTIIADGSAINDFAINISFDLGGGELNPQNLTTGEVTIKALIRKFPN